MLTHPWAPTVELQRPCPLSARELEVLQGIADGIPKEEQMASLGIQPQTHANHVWNAKAKLRAESRAHAVAICMRYMWII